MPHAMIRLEAFLIDVAFGRICSDSTRTVSVLFLSVDEVM